MPRALALLVVAPSLLACMGVPAFPPTIVRMDYSQVDGRSCMSNGGKPSLAYKQDWDVTDCAPRGASDEGRTDACWAAINAECCAQVGAEIVGWQAHTIGSEKLVSPLCRF